MKRIIILFILMLTVAATMQAQRPRHYGDTINGRNPNYFYQWWADEWYALDSVDETTLHPAAEILYDGRITSAQISLDYMYTRRGINIIGLAVAAGTIDYHEPIQQESLLLYDARPDTLILLKSVPWHTFDSFLCMNVEYHNSSVNCCNAINRIVRTHKVCEYYFDRPVYVEDSFYVGATCNSIFFMPPNGERNIHPGYNQFYTKGDYGCDSCPTLLHHKKIYGRQTGFYTHDNQWHDVDEPAYGMVFAIYRDSVPPPCAVPTGFRAERQQNSCLSVRWDADTTHLSWELSYGVLGSPRDSYTTIVCDSDHYTFCGLHEYETYAVYMRAICNEEGSLHSDWSDINLLYLGMPIAGIENVADDGILLQPNPADRQVTVSAPLPLHRVEVYDMAGRLVEAHQPNGTALQIDLKAYTSGTYLVKVTTNNGTTTKKLVVR